MKICPSCSKELKDNAKFCCFCGSPCPEAVSADQPNVEEVPSPSEDLAATVVAKMTFEQEENQLGGGDPAATLPESPFEAAAPIAPAAPVAPVAPVAPAPAPIPAPMPAAPQYQAPQYQQPQYQAPQYQQPQAQPQMQQYHPAPQYQQPYAQGAQFQQQGYPQQQYPQYQQPQARPQPQYAQPQAQPQMQQYRPAPQYQQPYPQYAAPAAFPNPMANNQLGQNTGSTGIGARIVMLILVIVSWAFPFIDLYGESFTKFRGSSYDWIDSLSKMLDYADRMGLYKDSKFVTSLLLTTGAILVAAASFIIAIIGFARIGSADKHYRPFWTLVNVSLWLSLIAQLLNFASIGVGSDGFKTAKPNWLFILIAVGKVALIVFATINASKSKKLNQRTY